jgi:hypothetical protein
MKYCPLIVLTFAMSAIAQRPDNGQTCDSGTPIPFNDGGSLGYATASGGVVIPPQFRYAAGFFAGVADVCTIEGCGLIDPKGKFITPLLDGQTARFSNHYSEGVGAFLKNDKWGYVDLSGNIVIPPKFRYAGAFDNGMARVALNGKCFFINHKGERVTPEFDGAYDFGEDLAAVLISGKVGYIRRDGTLAIPPKYQGTSGIEFSEGLVAVRSEKKVGFMGTTGSMVIKPAYDDAYPFSEGRALVRVGESWGYIDKTGKMVIPPEYRIAHTFNEGVASVQLADSRKWGYIDHAGAFTIPPVFDAAMPFCAGVASVETSQSIGLANGDLCRNERRFGKHGLIDHSGRYVWLEPLGRVFRDICIH